MLAAGKKMAEKESSSGVMLIILATFISSRKSCITVILAMGKLLVVLIG